MIDFPALILDFEQRGLVTRTFRRLDAARQDAVLRAVLAEAAESGPANLNIKKVAARADVSVGSLYQYFGSREGLLTFATHLVVDTNLREFAQYRDVLAGLPLLEAVPAYLAGGVEWGQQETATTRFFAAAAYQGDPLLGEQVVQPIARELREMMSAIVQAAATRGELRAGIDVEAAARLIYGLTIILGDAQLLPYLNRYFQVYDDQMTPERMLAALLDLLQRGLGRNSEDI